MRKRQWWWSYILVVIVAYALTVTLGTAPTPWRGELGRFVFDQYQRWLPRPSDLEQPVRVDERPLPRRRGPLLVRDEGDVITFARQHGLAEVPRGNRKNLEANG